MNKQNIADIITQNAQSIHALGVEELYLFGSFARGDYTPSSDIDFAIKLDHQKTSIMDIIKVKHYLDDRFEREVDVAEINELHPQIKAHMMKNIERLL